MEYLTPEQIAEKLNVSRKTVYNLLKLGKIPAIRIGAQWRIPETFLDEGTGNERQKPESK